MTRNKAIAAIVNASDDEGTIQAIDMLALCKRGALPIGRPELHTTMSVESALRLLGLTDGEISAALDD
jgi:hypothetical protein